jgi:hypothetical protein
VYANAKLKQELEKPEGIYPVEVCEEIAEFIAILKRDGQFTKTDFFDSNTHRVSGRTLYLFYRPQFVSPDNHIDKREVLIIGVTIKPADVFMQRFSIKDEWDDKDVIGTLPQYDNPKKLIKALRFIHQGILDSYDLGYALGHSAKKSKDIRRHGSYAQTALEELKLIIRVRKGRSFVPYLTEQGKLIAESSNEKVVVELLIKSMLNYPPVWQIISAVTHRAGNLTPDKVLTDELVKDLVFPKIFHQVNTSIRRSQTLKSWVKWISDSSGIPIWICQEGIQLPIPMLYAEVDILK